MALKRRNESHELATKDRLLQRNREATPTAQFLLDEIPTGDMRTLRNVEVAACEIQTGDMGTPPNRASVEGVVLVFQKCELDSLPSSESFVG